MKPIRQEIQDRLNEYDEYQLKTDEEICDYLSENGDGYYDFHASDINRLVVECMRMKEKLNISEI